MPVMTSRCQGFTLPEVMIAMGIGSMLMLSVAQLYPLIRQRSQSLGRHYQLEQLLRQTLFTVAKDLRRAGFCNGDCDGKPVIIGNAAGEATGSCVILQYDLNRNGRWEKQDTAESEYFGYRLHQGSIEIQRGAGDCSSSGWEKLLDTSEVKVTTFRVTETAGIYPGSLYTLQLGANWSNESLIHRQVTDVLAGHAL
ncbi:prepilin peptidase-dependent protein [Rahnella victoriana]|uniref:Prepilin peptidase-dependent protein n=1 Tax=Rahnella victoriana TaxID=1510570 RepID=A0ABS0DWZ5_9GAMM|nr:prepilin peptidase-dependent protein [Rahnella victoriana]MBF7958428.1 prepilin peptidase-dependent protein [Rahnella victoriana]